MLLLPTIWMNALIATSAMSSRMGNVLVSLDRLVSSSGGLHLDLSELATNGLGDVVLTNETSAFVMVVVVI